MVTTQDKALLIIVGGCDSIIKIVIIINIAIVVEDFYSVTAILIFSIFLICDVVEREFSLKKY